MASHDQLLPEQAQCSAPFYGGPQLQDVCSANSGILFLTMLNALVATNPKVGAPCDRVKPIRRPDFLYDFVVVGAGAAGATVAARLSESNQKVLLLEAGPDEPAGAQIPSNLQLYLNTELDWKYETENESFACLNRNGSCSWPRGKNLGGCTAHHGMAYHRGHPKDYERWVEMGNEGWSWDDVLPVFLAAENNTEIGRVKAEYHGTEGPLTVERFPYQPPVAWDILRGADEVGFGTTPDPVGDKITGFTVAQTLSRNGVRQSSARAELWPARDRKNLHISINSLATKILIKGGTAVGVEFLKEGKTRSVRVRNEVIVSGGAINSPQLLMLSGIGPADHLRSLGIPVVADLPGVGENLHNHASYAVDFTADHPEVQLMNVPNAEEYLQNQTGPMSSTGLAQVTGILPSSFTTDDDPDTQYFFAGLQAICQTDGRIADLMTYRDKETVRFTAVNIQTRSRGRITLRSSDPTVYPKIWSNELSDPQDVSIILEGLHNIFILANSTSLQKYNLTLVHPSIEACSQFQVGSDDYWKCAIHYDTRPENHQAGTCKMGPASDRLAVVDPRLRVHGIKGLRVADASIMPQVISGNPHAAVTMIGDRAVNFIKSEYGIEN